MLKVAQYAAQLEDYEKAIQIYEQVMKHFMAAQGIRKLIKYFVVESGCWFLLGEFIA